MLQFSVSVDEEYEPEAPIFGDNLLVERAVRMATSMSMPHAALASYARWWQLEYWLRELVYVELRAKYGLEWGGHVRAGVGRQAQDAAYTHMEAADTENPLAYLDYSQLIQVIESEWNLFEPSLMNQTVWKGRQEELARIRHRIGHIRTPHTDDLSRLDQTLRDLERGTYIALATYNMRRQPDLAKNGDPVTLGWLGEAHPTAKRLIRHAEDQYEVSIRLTVSQRPWATWPDDLSNAPGIIWHCDFFLRRRWIDARAFWNSDELLLTKYYLIHMLADGPHQVGFSFSAADDPELISDAIGETFDAVLSASRWTQLSDERYQELDRRARSVDYRLKASSPWNVVNDQTLPISNFGSGGGVESMPRWR